MPKNFTDSFFHINYERLAETRNSILVIVRSFRQFCSGVFMKSNLFHESAALKL